VTDQLRVLYPKLSDLHAHARTHAHTIKILNILKNILIDFKLILEYIISAYDKVCNLAL